MMEGIERKVKGGKDRRSTREEGNKRNGKASEEIDGEKTEMTKRRRERGRKEWKGTTERERRGSFCRDKEACGSPSFPSPCPPVSSSPAVCLCVSVCSATAAVTAVRSLTDCVSFLKKKPVVARGRRPELRNAASSPKTRSR